jgi:head-tail adaptor
MTVSTTPGFRREMVTRWEALQEDVAQQRALAELEAAHGGRERAIGRFRAWVRGERDWFQRTNTTYRIRSTDDRPDEDQA